MDKYFVVEPGAEPHGPYPLPEIANLLAAGTVSARAVLQTVGEPPKPAKPVERPVVIDVAPIEPTPPPAEVPTQAPQPPAAKVMAAARQAAASIPKPVPTPMGPPPGVTPPPSIEIDIHVDHTAPTEQLDEGWEGETEVRDELPAAAFAPPQAAAPIAAPVAAAPIPTAYVPPPPGYVPPAQPHHRSARGTLPQAPMALAVVEQPRRPKPQPQPQPQLQPQPQPVEQQLQQQPDVKPAEDPPPPVRDRKKLYIGIGVGVAALTVGGVAFALVAGGTKHTVKDSLVRVSTPSGTGTGFLINGPDEFVYVATANHLVDRGERVLIERDVSITEKKHYVEAYPETEIVATNPEADLAIIRVKNVEAKRFARLPLAKEPVKDAKIFSYGYPGSSLAKKAGLVSKDGKVLSLVRFPAYDDRYARIVRENAVEGLLVSTDIEPGFSGGPTTNESGEVVGINVTKDRAHVGQNGAVSVVALRELLAKVKPASKQAEPTSEDIVKLLKKVQSEYLLLPLDERSRVRETEFVAASDLPALRRFVNEVRREERNTDNAFLAKLRLSGQAALGMYFARLPGNLLETYRAPSTKNAIMTCALANQRLTSFLGELETSVGKRRTQPIVDRCDELGVRPLAWDLAAATLQWDGKEKDYTVTKIDRMDDEGRVYRASVRISGAANLIELWFGVEQGSPRLKLFDTTEQLYAIDSPRTVSPTALQGTWGMKRPRVTDAVDKNAEVESEEKVSVSIEDGKVSILYTSQQKYFAVDRRSFACNRKSSMDIGMSQSFTGTLENGVVIGLPQKASTPIGADADWCTNRRLPDQIIAIKLVGDQLMLYRTDGIGYPEALALTKQ